MSACFPALRPLALAVFGLAPALPLAAQLATKSPFLPSASETSVAAVASPLEFGGYIADRDGIRFRVKTTNGKTGAWVRLNERNSDLNLVAKQHDAAQDTLVVEYDGRTQALTQRKSKIVSAGAAPVPSTANVTPPGGAATVVPNYAYNQARGSFEVTGFSPRPAPAAAPSTADAQKALEDLAAQVNARRNARTLPAPASVLPAKR